MKKMGFVSFCKEYFGLKEGQTLTQFAQELKALTPKDKADLSAMAATVGYEIAVEQPLAA